MVGNVVYEKNSKLNASRFALKMGRKLGFPVDIMAQLQADEVGSSKGNHRKNPRKTLESQLTSCSWQGTSYCTIDIIKCWRSWCRNALYGQGIWSSLCRRYCLCSQIKIIQSMDSSIHLAGNQMQKLPKWKKILGQSSSQKMEMKVEHNRQRRDDLVTPQDYRWRSRAISQVIRNMIHDLPMQGQLSRLCEVRVVGKRHGVLNDQKMHIKRGFVNEVTWSMHSDEWINDYHHSRHMNTIRLLDLWRRRQVRPRIHLYRHFLLSGHLVDIVDMFLQKWLKK